MSHDVFISCSSSDKTISDAVCHFLEAQGVRCWIAPRDIVPGTEWSDAIIEAIGKVRVMVLVFSHHSNESHQVKREVKTAFERGLPVIPLRVENVVPTQSLEYYLGEIHWLDAFTPPLERHLDHLAETVRALLTRTSSAEAFGIRAEAPRARPGELPPRIMPPTSGDSRPAGPEHRMPPLPVASRGAGMKGWKVALITLGAIVLIGIVAALFAIGQSAKTENVTPPMEGGGADSSSAPLDTMMESTSEPATDNGSDAAGSAPMDSSMAPGDTSMTGSTSERTSDEELDPAARTPPENGGRLVFDFERNEIESVARRAAIEARPAQEPGLKARRGPTPLEPLRSDTRHGIA
jgi:hypothetical protein